MKKIYYLFLAVFLMPALMFAQQPANSSCEDAVIQTLVLDGPTVTNTGTGTDAVDLDEFGAAHVWEAFTIDGCSDLTIDLCGTSITAAGIFTSVYNGCPVDETVSGTSYTFLDWEACDEEVPNPTLTFLSLPAGTYYYPVMSESDPEVGVVLDDYTINFTAVTCAPEPDTCFYYAGPYNNLNTAWGGAPAANANGVCPTLEFTTFELIANEMWVVENFVQGTEYTFSMCDGPNAGSWVPKIAIINAADASVVAMEDACSITWTSPTSGTYIIGISEAGKCYSSDNDGEGGENGYAKLSCTGTTTGIAEADKATFAVYPNPSNGQFTIGNVDVAGSYTIEVIDLAGRVIHSQVSALSSNTETKVNLNDVAAGVYMVKMINTNDNTQAVQRIVIK